MKGVAETSFALPIRADVGVGVEFEVNRYLLRTVLTIDHDASVDCPLQRPVYLAGSSWRGLNVGATHYYAALKIPALRCLCIGAPPGGQYAVGRAWNCHDQALNDVAPVWAFRSPGDESRCVRCTRPLTRAEMRRTDRWAAYQPGDPVEAFASDAAARAAAQDVFARAFLPAEDGSVEWILMTESEWHSR